jgi:DNA-binding winged helix-turn-helix (wHTH) protein/TolB-like protein
MFKYNRSLIEFSDFSFDPATCFLRKHGQAVPLKKQSAEVLALLLENAGEVVSREQIRDHIWKDRLIEFDQGINACIRDIRQALNDDTSDPRFVETHPRIGYRFSAPLTQSGVRANRLRLLWTVGSGGLAVAILAWAMGAFAPLSPPDPGPPEPERIAIMPFQYLMDDPPQSDLAARLTDLFVLRISESQSRALVISADDLFGEDHPDPGMADVSRWLEADYVVAGALHQVEGEVRLSLRLIRTDGYVHLLTTSVPFESIDKVEFDGLISQIVTAMESSLKPADT